MFSSSLIFTPRHRRFRSIPASCSSALLTGFVEADRGPFLDCRAQIPRVAGEKHRHAVMVLGARRGVLVAEAFELGAVIGFEPARGLKRRAVETGGEVVFRGES